MSKETKSYRGIEKQLIKDVQHLAIDTDRTEGDLVNEALMLLLMKHQKKKAKKKTAKKESVPKKEVSEFERILNDS